MAVLAEIGIAVKYGHSEGGSIAAPEPEDLQWEQHEIELSLAPLEDAAEGVALTAWVLALLAGVLSRSHRLAQALELKNYGRCDLLRLRFPPWRWESTALTGSTFLAAALWWSLR